MQMLLLEAGVPHTIIDALGTPFVHCDVTISTADEFFHGYIGSLHYVTRQIHLLAMVVDHLIMHINDLIEALHPSEGTSTWTMVQRVDACHG